MKQEFETILKPNDIVVRQDNEQSTHIEENACFWYPLVRIKDTVFNKQDITSFNYTIGETIIPRISLVINDHNRKFAENEFPDIDDIITIRISNNFDTVHKPIKLDFIILDVDTSADSRTVSIEALQYVPILHQYNNIGFNDSLFNITKQIAKKCGLGFVSNINDSYDNGIWCCVNNYYDFIKYIQERMFISLDDSPYIFIDQFNNLNVISLKTAIGDRSIYKYLTNPSTGELFETQVDIKISNKEYIDTNNGDDSLVHITDWTPISNYGIGFLTTKEVIEYKQKDKELHLNNTEITKSIQNINALNESKDVIWSNYIDKKTVFGNILTSRKKNERLKNILFQGTYITCNLEFYIADIFCYMHIPIDIWNKSRNEIINSQNENIDIQELSEVTPTIQTNVLSLNETFTGSYLSTSNQYIFNNDGGNLIHRVKLLKLTNE